MLFRYGEDIETSCEEFETIMENAEQAKKLRRRQSDARWRANLASCYETLKLIIPLNARASKKQVSKAVILQETSKHINFLEDLLVKALQEKGRLEGQGDVDTWCEAHMKSIMNGFEQHHKQQHRRQRRRRRQPIFRDRRLYSRRTRNEHMIENGNEYSCNDNSSYDDVELMETLVCCDDNGAWSELVSSCSSIYEHDATPEKNNQASVGFTPVKLPPVCNPVHHSSKFCPSHSARSDNCQPMDLVDEKDFSIHPLDGSSTDHLMNLLCDELMWQSDDDSCNVVCNKLESTPRCGRQRYQQNDVTKPVKSFRILKVASHGNKDWSRTAPRCRRALDLSNTLRQPSDKSYKETYNCDVDERPYAKVEESSESPNEYEICDEGKDFIVLSHDLDTSTTEDPPEEVPNVVDTSLDNNSPLRTQQNEVGYFDDYSVASQVCSPQTQSKYFVRETAADLSLAPCLQFSKEEARNMSAAMDDCYDNATGNFSLQSGFTITTADQNEISASDEYNGFVGQYSPLFDSLLFSL